MVKDFVRSKAIGDQRLLEDQGYWKIKATVRSKAIEVQGLLKFKGY